MGGDRVGTLRVWSPSPPGVCPQLLGSVLTSWDPPSLLGVCPHLLRSVLTSWGLSSPVRVRPHLLGSVLTSWGPPLPAGVCPRLLESTLTSWGLSSPPGVCTHVLGSALTRTHSLEAILGLFAQHRSPRMMKGSVQGKSVQSACRPPLHPGPGARRRREAGGQPCECCGFRGQRWGQGWSRLPHTDPAASASFWYLSYMMP